jgi:transcriptional regulator with XRE-family HTH domain
MNKNVGQKIKEIREKKQISQYALAKKSGISITSIQKYEYGQNKPKIENIQKIAEALGVRPSELIGIEYYDSVFDSKKLANESKTLDDVAKYLGEQPSHLLETFLSLDETGQQRALEFLDLLSLKYEKDAHSN